MVPNHLDRIREANPILDILEQLLADRRLSQVTIADICRQEKIPRSSFYRRYGNLDAFLRSAFDQAREELNDALEPWITGQSSRLSPSLQALYLAILRRAVFWRRLLVDGRHETPELHEGWKLASREYDEILAARISQSYPWVDKPDEVAQLLTAMDRGLLFLQVTDLDPLDSSRLDDLFELAYRGYCSFLQVEMWTEKPLGSQTLETVE